MGCRLLANKPPVVVATPGRLWELLREGEPHLATLTSLRFLVLDEADRMVQAGHFQVRPQGGLGAEVLHARTWRCTTWACSHTARGFGGQVVNPLLGQLRLVRSAAWGGLVPALTHVQHGLH